MLKKIKNYFLTNKELIKKLDSLETENIILKLNNADLNKKSKDPRSVIKAVFSEGIEWYDHLELSFSKQKNYFDEAQMILHTNVFNNIKNKTIATITQASIKQHDPRNGIDSIRDAQMTINGIELINQELEEIAEPK